MSGGSTKTERTELQLFWRAGLIYLGHFLPPRLYKVQVKTKIWETDNEGEIVYATAEVRIAELREKKKKVEMAPYSNTTAFFFFDFGALGSFFFFLTTFIILPSDAWLYISTLAPSSISSILLGSTDSSIILRTTSGISPSTSMKTGGGVGTRGGGTDVRLLGAGVDGKSRERLTIPIDSISSCASSGREGALAGPT